MVNTSNFYKTPTICIIGAGFSGLTAAIQLKRKLNIDSFEIFDENSDVGGTWIVNRYPGCSCDTPSHLYSWSFEPNPDWSEAYASCEEIQAYMQKVSKKYDVYSKIRFHTVVKSTTWDETLQKWRVWIHENGLKFGEELLFDIVITGVGLLRAPKIPSEYLEFKGTLVHTAKYDTSIDLNNKIVGVVGSGSSAIQTITKIAPDVKELRLFQRNPQYVIERPQKTYSSFAKFIYKRVPFALRLSRLFYFCLLELLHFSFYENSRVNKKMHNYSMSIVETHVKDDRIKEKVKPNFVFGCKRILFHENYYSSLNYSHVHLHKEKLEKVTSDGVVINGEEIKMDVLILATGYETQSFLQPLKVIGKNGIDLNQHWIETKPSAYLGIITHSAPNHFILLGPNTLIGHNSIVFIAECQVDFIVSVIKEMINKGIRVIQPKEKVEMDYMRDLEKKMDTMVWKSGKCNAWYTNARDDVTALYPRNCISYWNETRKVNFQNFKF